MSKDFERVTKEIRDKVLAACEPIESSDLSGPEYVYAMGAALCELVRIHISFLAERETDFARSVVEAMEQDLVDLRAKYGWLHDGGR